MTIFTTTQQEKLNNRLSSVPGFLGSRGFGVLLLGAFVSLAVGCGAPKRGESEIAYKNRLAKYTIAGVLIGGYIGTYHAKINSPLPLNLVTKTGADRRLHLSLFYAALGGYLGYASVKYEGEIQRMIYEMRKTLSSSAHQALAAKDMGQRYAWKSSDETSEGDFKVVDRYTGSEGLPCQDLEARIKTDADAYESVRQTACQNSAGHWVLWTHG